jgi:hypothetical protein
VEPQEVVDIPKPLDCWWALSRERRRASAEVMGWSAPIPTRAHCSQRFAAGDRHAKAHRRTHGILHRYREECFHVVGLDSTGKPVLHTKFRRDRLLDHSANTSRSRRHGELPRLTVACHVSSRRQAAQFRIIPAQSVKPYVKSNKNDMVDAVAIAEAMTRPTMRFVQVRQPKQSARQALHRVLDR